MAEESVKRGRGRPRKEVANEGSTTSSVASKRPSKKAWLLFVIVTLLVAAGVSGFFGWRYYDAQKKLDRLSNPQEAAKVETQQLIDKVGKLTELPQGETPTIATVSDVAKLKGQTFFADAQNGDKALIYTQAKKAILYRPSTNKIINIAPLNIGSNSSATNQTKQ